MYGMVELCGGRGGPARPSSESTSGWNTRSRGPPGPHSRFSRIEPPSCIHTDELVESRNSTADPVVLLCLSSKPGTSTVRSPLATSSSSAMVLFKFGNYDYVGPLSRLNYRLNYPAVTDPLEQLCREVPSLPVCNLFFRQLLVHPKGLSAPATDLLGLPSNTSATFASALSSFGSGVNPSCSIPRMAAAGGASGSLGNIANIILCGLSFFIALYLAVAAGRRAAAVGRVEMRIFFAMYALVQAAQLVDTGAFLRAGGTALTWVSAVHLGLVVGL